MRASQLLAGQIGDLVTIDIGGATTDIHSVTEGAPEMREIQLNPEPVAKRTVEGDLGIYVNAPHVFELMMGRSYPPGEATLPNPKPLFPKTTEETALLRALTEVALSTALERHVGKKKKILTYRGEREVIEGKDLTAVRWVIGTGGALARLGRGVEMLQEAFRKKPSDLLLPGGEINYLIDRDYIMAAAGLMGLISPEAALKMMGSSFHIGVSIQ